MKLFLPGLFCVLSSLLSLAQPPVQTIRGRVTDSDTRTGLPGANVIVVDSDPLIGAITDATGYFVLERVPVGRRSIQASYIGYKPVIKPEILVISGKETILAFELEDDVITAGEIEVKARIEKDRPLNAMAMVSARSFSVEESRRYAGSVDDPMRAVANFAGVAGNPEVASNEIIIRGNSPKGLLWRVDGMDIPNPNHFSYIGTSGGGFTMFSGQVLNNSDFYTAAFPSEYGNALSGVFDMRFRNGNNSKYEFAVQLGLQGLDLAAEGPFVRGKSSSWLFNYRYSILGFLQYIDPGMKNRIPSFQDISFKINLPTSKAGTFSLVGIGGSSKIKSSPVQDSTQWKTLEERSKSLLDNRMGAVALEHQINTGRKACLRSFLSGTWNYIRAENSYLTPAYELQPTDDARQENWRFTLGTILDYKSGKRHKNRSGISFTRMFYSMNIQSVNPGSGIYSVVSDGKGSTDLLQAFSESKMDLSGKISIQAGLHFQYFFLNRHYSVEPRVAIRFQPAPRHALSFGYGMHSQAEDAGAYLSKIRISPSQTIQPNLNLDFSRAHHFVLGYDYLIRQDLRLKAEVYYQYLYCIPVKPGSYYSAINSNGSYFNDTLVNRGKSRNCGIDITLEKFLTHQYYFLFTVSIFDSRYTGGDGITRNTRFNSNLVVNLLGGKEWTIRKKNLLGVNMKVSYTGGEHYVPIDLEESGIQHREVLDETVAYKSQLPGFCYVDLTLTYRTNHRKFSGTWAVQIKNLLNQKPATGYIYNDFTRTAEKVVSIGILPLISYKVEF